ncbi:putative ADP-ribosylation factor GTPase activating protein [Leptomonas pyrrhocoris]|uniref:Putative ADP-ribosylation factor GTPase activating protein n=1 Tax=Leptomonas pyrrhocoris TaxID=157538 RepID=A0A0M9G3C3_LEPPY|nr:putative ADP-ribosylation factor GTPase activating protein [Leptomonas pyrrhocoris]KPA81296.1 putative ADP-ribosylation factor GTPase activating protein [Leptomonas pyrrhocoris]|eukprot:XP_015659735.1 putative ADP-ribosylation factor GTPase activating protein [Leptomonas pyrrhocoris]
MNIRQRKAERHKETLRKLSQEGGNKYCFDCDMRGPLYVVSDFNILVCSSCSAVHRSFQHKVKGITMSEFNEDEIARFMLGGNDTAEKVWLNMFKGRYPASGDVLALKDFIRDTFVNRRYCDQAAHASLMKAWEDPQAALAAPPKAPAAAVAAATSLAPPPPPPSAPAKPTAEPQRVTSAPASAQPPATDNVFDDLFAAPVQAPAMPPPPSSSATAAPPPTVPAPLPPPQNVSSLVDDLFAGAPAAPPPVTSAPTSGYSSAQPQQFAGFGGPSYTPSAAPQQSPYVDSTYASQPFSSGMPPPSQQQQQFFNFSGPPPQTTYGNLPNAFGNFSSNFAPGMPSMQQQAPQQQQQQYLGYSAPFNAPPMPTQVPYAAYNGAAQTPFSGPPPSQHQQQQHQQPVADFSAPLTSTHPTHANDPFKNLGDASVFAHLGGPPTGAVQQPSGGGPSSSQPAPPQNALPSSWGQPAPSPAQPFAWGEPMPQQQQQQPSPNNYMGVPPPSSTSTDPSGMPFGSPHGQGWGSSASKTSSSPNRSRITVLSVTKSNEPAKDVPPMWQ